MKKALKIILTIILILVLGFSMYLSYEINSFVTNLTPQEDTIKNEGKYLKEHNFDLDDFKNTYKYKQARVKNIEEDYDFEISTFNMEEGKDVFVFLHGLGGTGHTMDPMAKMFLDKGYACLVYDQRNSGSHPKKKNTFGIKEKEDLISLISYLKENYPKKQVNIFAESYGANTFLLAYPTIKDQIKLIILDSPMSRGEEMLKEGFAQSEGPIDLMMGLGNLGSKVIEGYSYKDTNGIDKIKEIVNPILIISSKEDQVVSFSQAQAIFDKASEDKELVISKSKHTEMFFNENERYTKAIDDFLNKYE